MLTLAIALWRFENPPRLQTLKVKAPLGVWGFIPSHFPSLPSFHLARNLASLCLGGEPKARVVTMYLRVLGYTKGMFHLKIIQKTLLWMTTMFTTSFILVNLFFHSIFTFFVIEMVVIVYDLDDLKMSLNVLKHVSRMLSHYIVLSKMNQQE